jgi:signal transduction histidine kinase
MLSSENEYVDSDKERQLVEEQRMAVERYLHEERNLKVRQIDPIKRHQELALLQNRAIEATQKVVNWNRQESEILKARALVEDRRADKIALVSLSLFIAGLAVASVSGRILLYQPLLDLKRAIGNYADNRTFVVGKQQKLAEIREIEEAFQDMAGTIESARDQRLKFIASVAHDLRNPLNSIKMATELLASPQTPEDKKQGFVDIAIRQVTQMDVMINDLLDTAGIESGNLKLQKQTTDLTAIVRDAAAPFQVQSGRHLVSCELPQDELLCEVDGGRIAQVLGNLINNAIKYSPHGGRVEIRLAHEGGTGVVTVSDEGIGVKLSDVGSIFEPFRRTSSTRDAFPGVGLGLSVSRRIVEAHGGTIEARPRAGKGTVFVVTLPIEAARAETN